MMCPPGLPVEPPPDPPPELLVGGLAHTVEDETKTQHNKIVLIEIGIFHYPVIDELITDAMQKALETVQFGRLS